MEEDTGKGSGKMVQDEDQSHCESSVEMRDANLIQDMMKTMETMVEDLSIRVQAVGDMWQNFKIDHTNGAKVPPEEISLEDLPPFPEKCDDVAVFRCWVEKIEKYFVDHHIREHTKVKLVAGTLKGKDKDWWTEIDELNKKVDEEDPQFSWVDMKKLFMVHCLLPIV